MCLSAAPPAGPVSWVEWWWMNESIIDCWCVLWGSAHSRACQQPFSIQVCMSFSMIYVVYSLLFSSSRLLADWWWPGLTTTTVYCVLLELYWLVASSWQSAGYSFVRLAMQVRCCKAIKILVQKIKRRCSAVSNRAQSFLLCQLWANKAIN